MPETLTDVPDATIQKVLAWVGDDPVRAVLALEVEQSRRARKTLIAELDKLIATHPVEVTLAEKKKTLSDELFDSAIRLHRQMFTPTVERKAIKISGGHLEGDRVEIVDVYLEEPTFKDKQSIAKTVHLLVDKSLELSGNSATGEGGVIDELAKHREARRIAAAAVAAAAKDGG